MSFLSTLSTKNQTSYSLAIPDFKKQIPNVAESYYIHGKPGSGKTAYALNLAREWIQVVDQPSITEQSLIRFTTFQDLVATARKSFTEGDVGYQARMRIRSIKEIPVLILDDIGTEKQTEFVDQLIYELVNYRYENELQTIFTSNFNLEEIGQKYHSRIASRITGMCSKANIFETADIDYRRQQNTAQMKATTDISQFKIKLELPAETRRQPFSQANLEAVLKGIGDTNPKLAATIRKNRKVGEPLTWGMLTRHIKVQAI